MKIFHHVHTIKKHIIKHHKKYLAGGVGYATAHFFVAKVFLVKVVLIKTIIIMFVIFGILVEHFSSADILPILRTTYTAFDLATKQDDGILLPTLTDIISKTEKHNLIQIKNILPIYKGNEYVKEIIQKIITLSEMQVNTTIQHLIAKNVLTTADIKTLNNKISITYILGCDKIKGSYTIQQSINTNNDIVNTTLENIILNVNICFDYFYIKSLPNYVQQITVHELGHYMYYFKDTNPQLFVQKCRKKNKMICSKKDFISSYAQSGPEEDYAESFVHRYLGYIPKSNTNLTEKINYFSMIFQKK